MKRLFRQPVVRLHFEALTQELGVACTVLDASGRTVNQGPAPSGAREPVLAGSSVIGSVAVDGSPGSARILSAMLSGLASQELEKKRIASEALAGYEALGTLREFTGRLSGMADASQAASHALDTLIHLTGAQGGCIASRTGSTSLRLLACIGDSDQAAKLLVNNSPFVTQTLKQGTGELVSDTRSDERIGDSGLLSLMCAPMIWGGTGNGLVLLGAKDTDAFTANDFELLKHVSLLTAAAVSHARYSRMLCSTSKVLDNPQPVLAST